MTVLLLALIAQWPLRDDEPPEPPTVHQIQTIEVNHYVNYGGGESTQLVFWEKDRLDQHGKRWAVYKGYVDMDSVTEWIQSEEGVFVWRGRGVEMRAEYVVETWGYDAAVVPVGARVLRFPVVLRSN